MQSLRTAAVWVFLASLGLNWPMWHYNARLPELLFLPIIFLVAATAPRRTWRLNMLDRFAALYLAGGALSLVATDNLKLSGIELARHAYVVAIYAAVSIAVRRGHLESVALGLAFSGITLVVVSAIVGLTYVAAPTFDIRWIGDVMTLPYIGPVLRMKGMTATPAMLASVLTMAVPFAVAALTRAHGATARRLWWAAIGILSVTAVMTFSHVLGGLLVAVLVMLWPRLDRAPRLRRLAIVAAIGAVLLCNLSVVASLRQITVGGTVLADSHEYQYNVGQGRLHLGQAEIVYDVMSYFRIKQLAWETFAAHPLFGIGLDRFHVVSERAFADGRLPAHYSEIDPHSALLGRLAETGIPGGVTLSLLWIAAIVLGRRVLVTDGTMAWPTRAAWAGLVGLLVAGVNVDVMNFRFLWAGLGLISGAISTQPLQQASIRSGPDAPAGARRNRS